MKKTAVMLFLTIIGALNMFGQVKKFADGTVIVAYIGNFNESKSTQGVRIVLPNKNVFVGTINLNDIDSEKEKNGLFPYRKLCGYEVDNQGSKVSYMAGEEVLPHATEEAICASAWKPISNNDIKSLTYDDLDYKDVMVSDLIDFVPTALNQSYKFNKNHTGTFCIDYYANGYCPEQYIRVTNAVGSNQYVTRQKNSSKYGKTGGYVFSVSVPLYKDFTWSLKNDTLTLNYTNVRVGKYIVTPVEDSSNARKEYLEYDCQRNPEIQTKKKYFQEYMDQHIDFTERGTYVIPIDAANSKYLAFNNNSVILRASDVPKSEIVDWFGYYNQIIPKLKIEDDKECGFADDRSGAYGFYIAGEEVAPNLTESILCNVQWTAIETSGYIIHLDSYSGDSVKINMSEDHYMFYADHTGFLTKDCYIRDKCQQDKGGFDYSVGTKRKFNFIWEIEGNVLHINIKDMSYGKIDVVPDLQCNDCSSKEQIKEWEKKVLMVCQKDATRKRSKMKLEDFLIEKSHNWKEINNKHNVVLAHNKCIIGLDKWICLQAPGINIKDYMDCVTYYLCTH